MVPWITIWAKNAVSAWLGSTRRRIVIRLVRVTAGAQVLSTLGRKLWIALTVLGAVAVVVLSWRVPEPESPGPTSIRKIDHISHSQWVPPEVVNPALTYGGR